MTRRESSGRVRGAVQGGHSQSRQGGADTDAACEQLYRGAGGEGVEVLYDDTSISGREQNSRPPT